MPEVTTEATPTPEFLPTDPPATEAPAATIAYQPQFEVGDCRFSIPPGYDVDCGDLIVPENRYKADSRTIRVHVAIFRSNNPNAAPDPVVHLSGGPGSPSLDLSWYYFNENFQEFLTQRDFIIFDPRGVGYSEPVLNCWERDEESPEMMEAGLGSETAYTLEVDSFARCRDNLIAQGFDLEAYNSAALAADVIDLKTVLGYDKINLYAVSYGTRLALTILRDHPEEIRSVILDSVYPPQANLYTGLAPNAERAFNALFDACAADPNCNAAYPDLRNTFYTLVDQLNANPVMVPVPDPETGETRQVKLTGGILIDVLFLGLYNDEVLVTMPGFIFDVRDGNYAYLAERLQLYFGHSNGRGMGLSVQCNEEIPFSTYDDFLAIAAGAQPQIGEFFALNNRALYTVCESWSPDPPNPIENQPVTSDVPVMILAGHFDPITPPEWGQMAAQTLPNSTYFEFPHAGHWVLRAGSCGMELSLAFLNDPSKPPDSPCVAALGSPVFR